MKATVALVILSLFGASQAGYIGNGATYSVRMPFSNPAGVTYIEGPAPAGLAAGPFVQSAGVYSAVSPAARLAPVAQVAHVAAPLPLTYSAAHVKTASVGYAAVHTVQHVPAVQDVPYTRIEATPGFVQKQVDVAKPAIATRKFEVRRPAIQKEFYDIEERVVVRPAGSAVVELDQPLSKTQKGETVIQTPAVAAVSAVAPVASVARVAAVSPVAYAGLAPAVARYSPFFYQTAHLSQPIVAAHLPQAHPTPLPVNPVQPAQPQPEQPQQLFEQPQQQFEQPQQQFEQPQQQFEQPQQQFEQPQQQVDQPQQQFEQPQQQFEQPQQQLDQPQQDNSDDTVVVGNPDISSRSAAPQPGPAPAPSAAPQQPAPQEDPLRQIKAEEEAIEAQRQELASRMAQLEAQRRQQQADVAALVARQHNLNVAAAATVNPASFRSSQSFGRQSQLTQARFFPQSQPQPQPQLESRSALPQPQPEARSAQPQPQPQPQPQAEARSSQPQPQPEARSSQPNVEVRSLGSPVDNLVPAPRSGNDVVPSLRNLSPEQDQENQQRLIELLTARVQRAFLYLVQGGVAEVGNQARAAAVTAAALDAGQVRARVLSATPAPPGAEITNERVSTRRVVVSRPIQTVQEVDVVEPFTKIHRLSVQQPALFKTARVDVARLHTAVPVYGKALQPYTVYH